MKRLIIFFISLMFILCLMGCSEENSKIEKTDNVDKYLDDIFNNEEVENVESWTGIEVWIFCDYSKHNKYEEWVEKYNLKFKYSNSREKYLDNYFDLLNTACYELIKDKLTNGEFISICSGEFLYFTYSSQEDLDKDYREIEKISKQEYVVKIVVQETKASQFVDE